MVGKICWIESKMFSFLVDGNNDYKEAVRVTINVVATISHGECKDV